MTDLLQRVEQNIRSRHLLKRGQTVLVGVSGGLDSMAMLLNLHALSAQYRWKLTVAHFNHELRGRNSGNDERFVRATAAGLKLPFVVGRANVRKFAGKSKLSIEMAARKLRHEFLARVARERNIPVVVLAHHADDQVELFFLRVLRGAGGNGLAGMKWSSPSPANSQITCVRPLLDVTKNELREFVRQKQIPFREDVSNACLDLPRNRVRNELLPLLRKRYQPALTKTILRLMNIIGAETNFVSEVAQEWMKTGGARLQVSLGSRFTQKCLGAWRIPADLNFERLPVAVQRRVLRLQLADLGVLVDFELVERLRHSPDINVSVSPDFSVARDKAGRVGLRAQPSVGFQIGEFRLNLSGGAGEVVFSGTHFRWSLADAKKAVHFGRQPGCEFFDADKVGGQITLRHWRAGDRFQPIGLKSAVKLQDLFTNQKIPRAQRHDLVVAEAADGRIFWVQNLRIAAPFKLTPETKRRLVWRWRCRSC